MNLIFDIGNSSTKMAIYDGHKKVTSFRSRDLSCEKLERKLMPYKIDKAIISSVRVVPDYIIDLVAVNIPMVHKLTHNSKLPFILEYETPETLGTDRIAAIAGAYSNFPGKSCLVIDAGSAVTYDFISGKKYKGGNISPGLHMRFRALHRYTSQLPLIEPSDKYISPGRNTTEAITAGVTEGLLYEINEYIRAFSDKHPKLKVIITGGDGSFLKSKIRYETQFFPDIVLDGLNYILEYNAK